MGARGQAEAMALPTDPVEPGLRISHRDLAEVRLIDPEGVVWRPIRRPRGWTWVQATLLRNTESANRASASR